MKPKVHPRIVRRTLLEVVRAFNERTDGIVKILAIALVVSIGLEHFQVYGLSEVVELTLRILHFTVAAGVVAYLICRRALLKDPNRLWGLVLTKQDCTDLREWLRTGKDPGGGECICLASFATANSLDALVDMNYEGFRETAFAVEYEHLKRRDAAWIEKNPRIFMMMIDPILKNEYIGYSALTPLNADGAELYLDGKLKDADLPASLLCGPNERPAAILVFAIVLKQEFSFSRAGAARRYSYYFWGCVRKHVAEIYPELFQAGTFPPLYAQAERSRMRDRLESLGFKDSGKESADGFRLWVLENASAPAQAGMLAAGQAQVEAI